MKLAAICPGYRTASLMMAVTLSATSGRALAGPPAPVAWGGADLVLVRVQACQGTGISVTSAGPMSEPAGAEQSAENFFDSLVFLYWEWSGPCESAMLMIELPDQGQAPVAPLDAAVWSRDGHRTVTAIAIP